VHARPAALQSNMSQQSAYQGRKYTRCEEELQCIICIAVDVGANSAHTKTTAVRRAPRTKTPPLNNEQKLQSGRHNLTRFHETAHNLLSHHVVSSHKTQHPSTHCSGFNATKASCQSPAPPHKTYTLQQVMDTSMALPSEGGVVAVVVAGRTNGDTRTLPL